MHNRRVRVKKQSTVIRDPTHLLGLFVAHVVRAAVAYSVGGVPRGEGDAVALRRGVPVGGGARDVGAVAGAEQFVRLGLQLLGMRRLLTHEGRLKETSQGGDS